MDLVRASVAALTAPHQWSGDFLWGSQSLCGGRDLTVICTVAEILLGLPQDRHAIPDFRVDQWPQTIAVVYAPAQEEANFGEKSIHSRTAGQALT